MGQEVTKFDLAMIGIGSDQPGFSLRDNQFRGDGINITLNLR